MSRLDEVAGEIESEMARMEGLAVAFSGGVDSSLVAVLAQRALGAKAVAVTAVSETLKSAEREEAQAVAREIGIRHELIEFSELDDERFRANTPSRCYFCQSMRFDQIRALGRKIDCSVIASGTNLSDLGEYRPGLRAMRERGVYQPLLEHRLDKSGVRDLARHLGLSVWNKPAQACLSSRIPHGLEVTDERLRRIEMAEAVLAAEGFREVRVRDLSNEAKIEVGRDEVARLAAGPLLDRVERALLDAGFETVEVDPKGYRSGSLNPVGASGTSIPTDASPPGATTRET